jgi:PPK2 family polyphosphate:nucleotide phosphotransferase
VGVTVLDHQRATMRAMAKTKNDNGKAAKPAPTPKMPEHVGDDIVDHLMVKPGTKADLKKRDPGWKAGKPFEMMATDDLKAFARKRLQEFVDELSVAQELLWASNTHAMLVIFQALDAAGKDGTIKHVMSGVNPQGCQVVAFKQPSAEERDHDFLWRCSRQLPERGSIGIFNRSYYEEVLVVRVHPEMLGDNQPKGSGNEFWKNRFEDINAFEQHLSRNGTKIVKFFLHVSKDEQRRRFLERAENPDKHWKFSGSDMAERARWDDYTKAYEDMLTATSTSHSPWYVIPADHKYVMRTLVAGILARNINALDLSYPEVTDEQMAAIVAARDQLRGEK